MILKVAFLLLSFQFPNEEMRRLEPVARSSREVIERMVAKRVLRQMQADVLDNAEKLGLR